MVQALQSELSPVILMRPRIRPPHFKHKIVFLGGEVVILIFDDQSDILIGLWAQLVGVRQTENIGFSALKSNKKLLE